MGAFTQIPLIMIMPIIVKHTFQYQKRRVRVYDAAFIMIGLVIIVFSFYDAVMDDPGLNRS